MLFVIASLFEALTPNGAYANLDSAKMGKGPSLTLENDSLTSSANDLDDNTKELTDNNSAVSNPVVTLQGDHLTSTANGGFVIQTSQDQIASNGSDKRLPI